MRKRSQKSIRYHRFNRTKNPHEWHYSELLLYLPFNDENELHPNDLEKCLGLYLDKIDSVTKIKKQVMPYLDGVIEAREKAEEFISSIGDELDSNKEKENDEADNLGQTDHPELNFKDPGEITDENVNNAYSDTTFR